MPKCESTIGQEGCFITGLAMAQRFYGLRPDATPLTVDQALGSAGYYQCLARWSAIREKLGIQLSTGDTAQVEAFVRAGGCAMARVPKTDPNHFVLVVDWDDEKGPWMLDSWLDIYAPLYEHYADIHSWRILRPIGDTPPIVSYPTMGLHDAGGGQWFVDNDIPGVCLVHHQVQQDPITDLDYRYLSEKDVTVICRLNWGYANGTGTLPPDTYKEHFISAVVHTILSAKGVDFWHIGNEPNNQSEWPGFGTDQDVFPLTPEYVVEIYNEVWRRVNGESHRANLGPAPIDPYFGPGSDNSVWQRYIWENIADADAVFLHAKTQTNDPNEVDSDVKFSDDPLTWQYLHMRTVDTSLDMLLPVYYTLPVFVTEANPQCKYEIGGDEKGWIPGNTLWITESAAFGDVRDVSMIYYRYDEAGDQKDYGLKNQAEILEAIKANARYWG